MVLLKIAFKLKSKAVVPELRATEYFDFVYLIKLSSNFFTKFPPVETQPVFKQFDTFFISSEKNMAHAKEYYSFMIIKYFTIKFVFFDFFK